ncbi:MAG: rRNA maturation RNase YbeY [Candidatus Omnitrophica bacterium]|nr:rRNA maturation RNase YbeY [Candidatus Omnitrophota bacterium]
MNIAVINLQHKIPVPVSKIKSAARRALREFGDTHRNPNSGIQYNFNSVYGECPQIHIVFVGPKRMRRINAKYLGHDYVTDVIAFDHGEIIVCPQMAVGNARIYGNTVEKEIILYAIHGILHLAGYEDKTPQGVRRMRAKEQEFM